MSSSSSSKKTKKGKEKVVIQPPQMKENPTQMKEMTTYTRKFYNKLVKQIKNEGITRNMPTETIDYFIERVYKNIVEAGNQNIAVKQMLKNIEDNKKTATNINDLVFTYKGTMPIGSDITMAEPSSSSTVDAFTVEEDYPVQKSKLPTLKNPTTAPIIEDDAMILDEPAARISEPILSKSQLKHINDVVKIMEKEPKLKADIKRTITEELTKGYINKDQFKKYNEEIEKVNIMMETPEAIRGKRTIKKQRAKKSKQVDTPIVQMDIESSPKIPKGKTIKDNQKKKQKIVTL